MKPIKFEVPSSKQHPLSADCGCSHYDSNQPIVQVIVSSLQASINETCRGIGWWLAWSVSAAAGRRCRFRFALPLLFLFAASLLGSGGTADQYFIQDWTVEKRLSSDSATAIAQTRDGFIWIGCEEGLARFDGLRMEVFNRKNTPALQDHYIRSLCPDEGMACGSGLI